MESFFTVVLPLALFMGLIFFIQSRLPKDPLYRRG